jgi:hypothetical protein
MTRQAIDEGGWFDRDAAKRWSEGTRWDGSNHISVATGSQWEHESLWRTKRGVYVLHAWSDWQGSGEGWTRIDASEAAEWLIRNGHEATSGELQRAVTALEI